MTSGSDHPSVSSDFTGTVEICDIVPSGMFLFCFYLIAKEKEDSYTNSIGRLKDFGKALTSLEIKITKIICK